MTKKEKEWIPAFAGMTKKEKRKRMDSRLRGNDKKRKKKNMGGTPTLHMGKMPMLRRRM